jgi:hypothetical protein
MLSQSVLEPQTLAESVRKSDRDSRGRRIVPCGLLVPLPAFGCR